MSEDNTKGNSVRNEDSRSELGQTENVLISCGWKNDRAILILNNRGPKGEHIEILYSETDVCLWHSFKIFQLPYGNERIVELHKEFEKWKELSFKVGRKRGRISVVNLKKMLDKAKQQTKIEHPSPRSSRPFTEVSTKPIDEKQNQQFSDLQSQFAKLEQTVIELKTEIENLKKQSAERARENSKYKVALDELTAKISGNPEQIFHEAANYVLQMTFAQQEQTTGETLRVPSYICEVIKAELDRFKEQLNGQESYTLSAANQQLGKAQELMQFRLSEVPPPEKFRENQPKELAELILVDEPPDDIRFPYFEVLCQAYWRDLKTYASKLSGVRAEVQSILDQTVILLVDGFSPYRPHNSAEAAISRSFYENCLPNILQIMGLELVPIEIGETIADARIHDIQGTQRGAFKPGVIADIILHGLCRSSDQNIIKKPVVMRGEPE